MDIPEDISAAEMYRELMEQIRGKGRCYLLLDEMIHFLEHSAEL